MMTTVGQTHTRECVHRRTAAPQARYGSVDERQLNIFQRGRPRQKRTAATVTDAALSRFSAPLSG
jgi:hypothetical protein